MKKINGQLWTCLFLLLLLPSFVSGQEDFGGEMTDEERETFGQISEPIVRIYKLTKYISTVVAGLVLLWSGIGYMMGGSDPKKRDTAKLTGMCALIGLGIIWAAPIVVNFIVG